MCWYRSAPLDEQAEPESVCIFHPMAKITGFQRDDEFSLLFVCTFFPTSVFFPTFFPTFSECRENALFPFPIATESMWNRCSLL